MLYFNKKVNIFNIFKNSLTLYFNNFLKLVSFSIMGVILFNIYKLPFLNIDPVKPFVWIIRTLTNTWIYLASIIFICRKYYKEDVTILGSFIESRHKLLKVCKLLVVFIGSLALFILVIVVIRIIIGLYSFMYSPMLIVIMFLYAIYSTYALSIFNLALIFIVLGEHENVLKNTFEILKKNKFTVLVSNFIVLIIIFIPILMSEIVRVSISQSIYTIYNILMYPIIGCLGITVYDNSEFQI